MGRASRGRVVVEALLAAFSEHHPCEQPADVDLLQHLGDETSGDPIRGLVSAGVVAPKDALRVGLEVLERLGELCNTGSASVLERVPSALG